LHGKNEFPSLLKLESKAADEWVGPNKRAIANFLAFGVIFFGLEHLTRSNQLSSKCLFYWDSINSINSTIFV